ncbi:MAG: hypothetical protein ACRENE_07460 [Polyangiaceae bacterium]
MSPASKLSRARVVLGLAAPWALAAPVFVCGACGHVAAPPVIAPPSGSASAPRAPDGVALDPPPALPAPASRAPAGGVAALRVPVSREAVAALLRSFFDAWSRESVDDLAELLAPDAGPLEARTRGSRALVDAWRQRMRTHEYGRLAGVEMVRPERIERWEADELGAEGAPPHVDARPGELTVRAPVETTTVAGERLFGDEVVMLVRAEGGKLKIEAYAEVEGR